MLVSASGAGFALVLGKLVVGLVLAGLALGFLLRLKRRKEMTSNPAQLRPGTPAKLLSGCVAGLEVTALVEATNLPVRFDQAGFHMGHWYLIVLAFFAACALQLPLLEKLLVKLAGRSAA